MRHFIISGLGLGLVLILVACTKGEKTETQPGGPKEAPLVIVKGDLIKAVVRNDYAKVVSLLNAGADVNENIGADYKEVTPLLTAVAFNQEKIAQLLLERGAATHPAYNRYTARDFEHYINGDTGPLRRILIQREILKTSGNQE